MFRCARRLVPLALAVLLAPAAHGQDLGIKAPPQAGPIAIINARVHPVASQPIESGYITFDNGVITALGSMNDLNGLAADARQRIDGQGVRVIDAAGQRVYPGLFVPYTQLGLIEIAAVRATLDYGEVGFASPEVRAVAAVNPDSTLFPVARTNGVLLAGVFPLTNPGGMINYFAGPGGMIPGRPGVIRLDGWTWEDMTVLDDAGLVLNWPQARPIEAWWMDKSVEEQQKEIDERVRLLDEFFTQARAYHNARGTADAAAKLPTDLRFEGMRSVLGIGADRSAAAAKRPVFILANDVDQITQAVLFCARHGVRCVLVGGHDAPLCADLLKRHEVSVIVPGTIRFPKRDDSPFDEAYTLPARLEAAGIEWCMASGEEAAHERNLPYAAALAVAYGLDADAAVRSITLSPAKMLGVADRYGSLEVGKSATLIVTNGDVLEIATNPTMAFIDGRTIDLRNKQTELEHKYREKYRQIDAQSPR
ncbi:MAG: amidohydrolase family protein [Phycisphaeraceae bacterium]|nr:amidohydrolase family protein [Phycisphaeraceae bacterium]